LIRSLYLLLLASLLAVAPAVAGCGGAVGGEARLPVVAPVQPHEPAEAGDLASVLRRSASVRPYVDAAASYRLAVLVGVPTADGRGIVRKELEVDATYFYPGSAIKLCSTVAALEAIGDMRAETGNAQLDANVILQIQGKHASRITLAAAVDHALVFSDNEAHNVLFDFVGHDEIHERMWRLGLDSVRIRHRLARSRRDDARETPAVLVRTPDGDPFVVPARSGQTPLGRNDMTGVLVGDEHVVHGSVVAGPMSFEDKNRISLSDLQDLLVTVVRPELRPGPSPRLGVEERRVLLDALAASPSERGASAKVELENNPLRAGVSRLVGSEDLVAYGKSGRAYGFVVDNAYFFDKRTAKSFFLSVTVFVNGNGRIADDVYEYHDVALPLLADIGEMVAREELGEPSP
jgi:hypothetical protein